MKKYQIVVLWIVALAMMTVVACRSSEPPDAEARIQTRVAEEQAVAATLTASAGGVVTDDETPTSEAVAQITIATDRPVAADTPAPATDTSAAVDVQPAATQPPPTPTQEIAQAPPKPPTEIGIGGGGGAGLDGAIRTDISLVQDSNGQPTFRDQIYLRMLVRDPSEGNRDGDGIDYVEFFIEEDFGDSRQVHFRRENNAGYCSFGGGEPLCNVISIKPGATWPDSGIRIQNNDYYAEVRVYPDGQNDYLSWDLFFTVTNPALDGENQGGEDQGGDQPDEPPAPNTARINSISEDGGRYIVEFDAFDFEPTLPGQHLHFFWNTVPPQQAGAPGSGPWQLYPASNGVSATSPFTLFGVDDRPGGATQICLLVANPNHGVNQGTGNCVDLP